MIRGLIQTLCGLAVVLLTTIAPAQAKETTLRIEAVGQAFVANAADRDSARIRALSEALVSAAFSGGATLRGHTVLDRGRITADLSILRPVGRVLSYTLTSASLDNGLWTVRINAVVGPADTSLCSGQRRLTISATPPRITVAPDAPSWSGAVAQALALDLVETLRRHPAVDLDSIAPNRSTPVSDSLDYTTLTRGQSQPAAGDHRMGQEITVTRSNTTLDLTLFVTLQAQDGTLLRRELRQSTRIPKGGLTGMLTTPSRSKVEAALRTDMTRSVTALLEELTCQPVQARLALAGGTLQAPLGTRHGLTRGALAFVEDRNDGFGILEIVSLTRNEVQLRPLDPTRPAASFDGLRVSFVEVGL